MSRASAIGWVGLLVAALFVGMAGPASAAPPIPSAPWGTACGAVGTSYTYYAYRVTHDPYEVSMRFVWGDGTMSDYVVPSGILRIATHAWSARGTYAVQAQARDITGESALGAAFSVTMGVAPSAPASLIAVSGNSEITLVWDAPSDNGGAPILYYRIFRQVGSLDPVVYGTVGDVRTFTDTAVTPGTQYTYQVAAMNCADIGPLSAAASGVPGIPGAPTLSSAVPAARQVTLTWTAPADIGSSPITNYMIYRGTAPGTEAQIATVVDVRTYLNTGLADGRQYCYQVAARNAAGIGPRSNERCATTPVVPGAPTLTGLTAGDARVTLTWTAPTSDGGSPITNYRLYRGTVSLHESYLGELGNVLTYANTGLTNGQLYCYNVSAKNAVGEGARSTELCGTPKGPPGIPRSLVATPGDANVTLTWQAPASDGGSPVTNYRIYRATGAPPGTLLIELGNVLTFVNTSLTNGQLYYYWVSAKNALGESPVALATARPRTVPGAPTGLAAVPGNGQVTLSWIAPGSSGGSAVTNYRIYRGTASGALSLLAEVGNVLAYADTGLTNGQAYFYQVSATNVAGEGAPSTEASATPKTYPDAPTGLRAVAAHVQVTLNWTAPSDGGATISNYKVYRGTASGSLSLVSTVGNVLTYTDTGLTNGAKYYFQVSAVNSVGEGARSVEVSATPADAVKPSVAISSPAHLATVDTTTVTVAGTASDNAGIDKVELSTDGVTWVAATGGTAWSGLLTLLEGNNTIYARATDTSGNTATSTIQVTVQLPTTTGAQGLPGWVLPVAVVGIAAVAAAGVFLWRRSRKPKV